MSETLLVCLSVNSQTIERYLSTLKENGVLKREGKDNADVWIINVGKKGVESQIATK